MIFPVWNLLIKWMMNGDIRKWIRKNKSWTIQWYSSLPLKGHWLPYMEPMYWYQLIQSSISHSFKGRASVNCIYEYLIFKQVAVSWWGYASTRVVVLTSRHGPLLNFLFVANHVRDLVTCTYRLYPMIYDQVFVFWGGLHYHVLVNCYNPYNHIGKVSLTLV